MTKEDVQGKLDERGIKYDGRLKLSKLLEVLDQSESEYKQEYSDVSIKNIAQSIIDDKKTKDDGLECLQKITVREDGEMKTPSGIIVPSSVVARHTKVICRFFMECSSSKCIVNKEWPSGKVEFVREYSSEAHGNDFKELAIGFVKKFNAS